MRSRGREEERREIDVEQVHQKNKHYHIGKNT